MARPRALLNADREEDSASWSDAAIAAALDVNPVTVPRVRQHLVEEGPEPALERKPPDRVYACALDGAAEVRLVALACSDRPPPSPRRGRRCRPTW